MPLVRKNRQQHEWRRRRNDESWCEKAEIIFFKPVLSSLGERAPFIVWESCSSARNVEWCSAWFVVQSGWTAREGDERTKHSALEKHPSSVTDTQVIWRYFYGLEKQQQRNDDDNNNDSNKKKMSSVLYLIDTNELGESEALKGATVNCLIISNLGFHTLVMVDCIQQQEQTRRKGCVCCWPDLWRESDTFKEQA